jgi:Protein of unknown function (DUF1592)/Protein of unknown function (DUF1588)/Protein of unknown function (DUF1585)/Protein of unknown function (DUF1587)/Protein of unknown function (DUF1595)
MFRRLRIGLCLVPAAALALGVPGTSHAADPAPAADSAPAPPQWNLIQRYCTDCHNVTDWAGGVAFDSMTPEEIPTDAKVWEDAVRKLQGGFMPPPGAKQHPDPHAVTELVSWLEGTLDSHANATAGRTQLRRLNRREYANAVRDLLALDIDVATLLPDDHHKTGYDTDAARLQVSPSYIDQYVNAARVVATQAVGNPKAPAITTTYGNLGDMVISLQVRGHPGEGNQQLYRDGMPFGTRGGMSGDYVFPADGDYALTIGDLALARDVPLMEFDNTVVALLDGKEFFRTHIGGEQDQKAIDQQQQTAVNEINGRLRNIRFHATQGQHRIAVTFVHRDFAESDERLRAITLEGGQERVQLMHAFQIRGPLTVTGMSDSPTRGKIFLCHPASAAEEAPCAHRIIEHLARLAFRRPVSEADLHPLLGFYESGVRDGGFEGGIRDALSGILASPWFLYRVETPANQEQVPTGTAAAVASTLSDLTLASRLSFFLWSSVPDNELLNLAEGNQLSDPKVLERQVRRMLADPRSKALVDGFFFQWLNLARLDEIVPDRAQFPFATGPLDPRPLFKQELALFLDNVLRTDQPATALLTANYTYLNESLAMLYGMEDVKGGEFRRVSLPDSKRWGLLGKGAILMLTANPDRTSPVLRGAWIVERILGSPAPTPPPNVPTLAENVHGKPPATVRERVMQHSTNPTCHGCHGVMDPLGFALENFNTVGQFRELDPATHTPIDTAGTLADGTVINGPDDLRRALTARSELFVQTLTGQLMSYAVGRPLDYYDMPVVRRIARDVARDNDRFSSIILQVVESDAFRRREPPAPAPQPAVKSASLAAPTADQLGGH